MRILVIEDDPATQYAVKEKLTSLGYQPFVVKLGKEGLEAAKVQSFDLIYTDIGLPDQNGLNIARVIRE